MMAKAAAVEVAPQQRPLDPRLALLEKGDFDPGRLCPGQVHRARNGAEMQALSGKVKAGDQVVLTGSEWANARFSFRGEGTFDKPILIRADNAGAVVFSGVSQVTFSGEHLIICGLEFRQVRPAKSGAVIFRLGDGKAKPANHCIVHRVKIADCGSTDPADWPKVRMWYLMNNGAGNTVADCTFGDFKNYGQMLGAQDLPANDLLGLHLINDRFVNRPYIDEQNGYEVVQIGWSGEKARPCGALIQGCVFEHCDGENELITLKASDVVVRDNKFLGCQSVLCIREGDRVLVQGNVFDGQDRPNTGGVRLQGADHVISGNVFRRLKKPRDFYSHTISLMAASAEKSGDDVGYARARNILITKNRFKGNDTRIAVGIYPRKEYALLPRDVRVTDNVFVGGGKPTTAFDYVAPDATGDLMKGLREAGNQFLP